MVLLGCCCMVVVVGYVDVVVKVISSDEESLRGGTSRPFNRSSTFCTRSCICSGKVAENSTTFIAFFL